MQVDCERLAVGETVILLDPPLPLVGVSIETKRECQQNGSLADGYKRPGRAAADHDLKRTRGTPGESVEGGG